MANSGAVGRMLERFFAKKLPRLSHRLLRANPKPSSFRSGDGIGENDLGQEISILSVGVGDVGFGLAEFSLREFHDRGETQIVTRLRQVEREVRLLAELLRHG